MARTDLTVTQIPITGVDLEATLEAANADGEAFLNNGETFLLVKNANAATCTVTFTTPRTVDGLTVQDPTVDVAQNEEMMIGPFPRDTYNQKTGTDAGKVYVGFSHVNDLEVAAFRL